MTFLTGKGIIDDVMTIIKNNSTPVRGKMLSWLNITAQKLAVERAWQFLNNGTATLTPADNVLTLPADFGQLKSLQGGDDFFLTSVNKLSDEEAWRQNANETIRGYTESLVDITDGGVTTRTPLVTLTGTNYTGDVIVKYTIEPPVFCDTTVATVWPTQCRALFMRSLLDFFYEYDMDERAVASYQINAGELSALKTWDNRQKPKPQPSRHGYTRGR